MTTPTKTPALLPTQEDREAADRLIAVLERENPSHSGRDSMAEAFARHRLRHSPAPGKGEGILEKQAREVMNPQSGSAMQTMHGQSYGLAQPSGDAVLREALEAAKCYIEHIGCNQTERGLPHPQQLLLDKILAALASPPVEGEG